MQHELVIKGGKVVTQSDIFMADVAISNGKIVAIGSNLASGKQEINAQGKWVLPGGVDSHCHIEQLSGAGIMNADSFESATRSAAYGGTTSVISFAAQHAGMRLNKVVAD
ncbi:MAG: dihydropyrimidinase, partial [Rhizobiales bacterium]|nr:dihydropyrimidinase [Hyphomicrobiales bacterium]